MEESILDQLRALDVGETAAKHAVKRIVDKAIPNLKRIVDKWKRKPAKDITDPENLQTAVLVSSEDDVIAQFLYNIKWSKKWCDEIKFRDLDKVRQINDIFVKLDFYLTPKRVHLDTDKEKRLPLSEALNFDGRNFVILGGPGAGKTTLAKYVTSQLFSDNGCFGKQFSFPFVIRLRDVSSSFHREKGTTESLYYILMEKLGIQLEFHIPEVSENLAIQRKRDKLLTRYYSIVKRVVSEFIEEMGVLLVLDGYDEVSDGKLRRQIAKEISELSMTLGDSNFLLTSRTGEFDISVEHCHTYELCSLTDNQIKEFVGKWIKDETKSLDLYDQIVNSPFRDTAIRPLNVAHLCALYKRYNSVPDRPKSVYKKVVNLLVEDWDNQRPVERTSRYSGFTSDRKADFLSKMAFVLTTQLDAFVFTKTDLKKVYEEIRSDFELPANQSKQVVDEIESHNGLLIQSGFDKYEFSHKSLQEFLCADYISTTPMSLTNPEMVLAIPNELAIAIAISRDPNMFLGHIVFDVLGETSANLQFLGPFFARLSIEKPDYSSNPILACSIAEIYTNIVSSLVIAQHPKFENIWRVNRALDRQLLEIESLIEEFSKTHVNINKSFSKLHEFYDISPRFVDFQLHYNQDDPNERARRYSRFVYKLIKRDSRAISQMPDELFINELMLKLIQTEFDSN